MDLALVTHGGCAAQSGLRCNDEKGVSYKKKKKKEENQAAAPTWAHFPHDTISPFVPFSPPLSDPFSTSFSEFTMLRSMDLGDVPEVLVMMSKYLGTNTLARVVRVSRQWHRHLLPQLWYWIYLLGYQSRFRLSGPQFLRSLFRYGHLVRVLCLADVKTLDLFRPPPYHLPRR